MTRRLRKRRKWQSKRQRRWSEKQRRQPQPQKGQPGLVVMLEAIEVEEEEEGGVQEEEAQLAMPALR